MKITLRNCDCLAYMKTVPDKYYDVCIADTPYGIGRDWEKRDWRSRANAVFIDKDGKEIEWDRFSKLAATRRA